jgi:hypothetical protein
VGRDVHAPSKEDRNDASKGMGCHSHLQDSRTQPHGATLYEPLQEVFDLRVRQILRPTAVNVGYRAALAPKSPSSEHALRVARAAVVRLDSHAHGSAACGGVTTMRPLLIAKALEWIGAQKEWRDASSRASFVTMTTRWGVQRRQPDSFGLRLQRWARHERQQRCAHLSARASSPSLSVTAPPKRVSNA